MKQILTETASKWGNMYKIRYYLDGRRISQAEADTIFEKQDPKQISSERVPEISGWRSKWEVSA